MSNKTKTFRLFISSTFDDFKLERDVLQEKVFPALSELCNKYGFGFMPIDLRWGINQEAQIDQKTIELCLNEVKACKSEPHPDFIIMLGDRYGWIPLPYQIESSVFESIYNNIPSDKREKIDFWYRLDLNALPASYILQKREKKFIPFENWQQEELEIKTILQQAMPAQQINNYFISATEMEYREYNSELIAKKENTLYFINRKIEKNGYENTRFFEEENKLLIFKQELQSEINIDNQLILKTCFSSHNQLDTSYLDEFANFLINKLSDSIHREITRIHSIPSSSKSDIHFLHKTNLSNMTIGRDVEIQYILNYISDPKNKQPLIIYGPSGIGKSTIIASTINKLKEKSNDKILYRFGGLNKEASTTKSILMSIFQDLGFEIENYALDNREDYVNKVNNLFFEVKDPIVVFIDALDQLDDQDNCEWLPSILPDNIKIIISVLKDDNYIEDNFYYEKLSQLSHNIYEISPLGSLKDARQIILKNLEIYNRTLQQNQLDYVLKQYSNVNSPLYLKIISEEIRHWNSDKKDLYLTNTQQNAITEYIKNLTTLFHHEKILVEKIFAYIYASQETLTESLLYEILSNDQELIQIVERVEHRNNTHKLPMAIWTRLYYQISPFIKENENGHIEFFHREFKNSANKLYSYDHSQKLLSILELMIDIIHYDNLENELINAHSKTLVNQQAVYPKRSLKNQLEYFSNKATNNLEWVNTYNEKVHDIGIQYFKEERLNIAIPYFEVVLKTLEFFYNADPLAWSKKYIILLNNLAGIYSNRSDYMKHAIMLGEKCLNITEQLYHEDPSSIAKFYITSLNTLSLVYQEQHDIKTAITLSEKSIEISALLYHEDPILWSSIHSTSLNNLAEAYRSDDRIIEACNLQEQNLKICEHMNIKDDHLWSKYHINALRNLAGTYSAIGRFQNAIDLEKNSLEIVKPLYEEDEYRWRGEYILSLMSFASSYTNQKKYYDAIKLQEECLEICQKYYHEDTLRWEGSYTKALVVLASNYDKVNRFEETINLYEKCLPIQENLYKKNKTKWADIYTNTLNNLAFKFYEKKHLNKAIKYLEKAYNISAEFYGSSHYKTLELKKVYFTLKKKNKK